MKTLAVTQIQTLTSPDGVTTDQTNTFRCERHGWSCAEELRVKAAARAANHHDTFTLVPNGIRIDYARPYVNSGEGWTIRTLAEILVIE